MKWFKTLITAKALFITSVAMPPAAFAVASDPMIEGAKLCTRHLPRFEREYAIPTHLLSAIATTESGRYHSGLGMKLPWPWSINAAGKGYWFDTKAEAIAAAKKLRAQGIQSMDVGCMQVNLMHHSGAFASLEEAFEPNTNIGYAASFLRNLYDEGGSWKKAAGDYHSKTPSLGKEYVGQVYGSWYAIIDKLRLARLNVPETSVAAMRDLKSTQTAMPRTVAPVKEASVTASESKPKAKSAPRVIRISSTDSATVVSTRARLIEQQNREVAAYQSPRMNSISVTTSSAQSPSLQERYASPMLVRNESNAQAPASDTARAVVQQASLTQAQPQAQVQAATTAQPQQAATAQAPIADAAPQQNQAATTAGATETRAAGGGTLHASLQTPVQRILVNPDTGRTVETQSDTPLGELSPAAGNRRILATPERSGPNFIFSD